MFRCNTSGFFNGHDIACYLHDVYFTRTLRPPTPCPAPPSNFPTHCVWHTRFPEFGISLNGDHQSPFQVMGVCWWDAREQGSNSGRHRVKFIHLSKSRWRDKDKKWPHQARELRLWVQFKSNTCFIFSFACLFKTTFAIEELRCSTWRTTHLAVLMTTEAKSHSIYIWLQMNFPSECHGSCLCVKLTAKLALCVKLTVKIQSCCVLHASFLANASTVAESFRQEVNFKKNIESSWVST